MRKIRWLLLAFVAVLLSGPVFAQLSDITQPGDPIVPTSNNSPGSETVDKAIDDTQTKYLNFDKLNTGFTVSPRVGLSVVQCLTLLSANDAPERDPASFTLEGSYDSSNFVMIASGPVPAFPSRYFKHTIPIGNNVPYLHYRLIFPTVSNEAAANSMQIAEVELLGFLAPTDVTQPGDPIVPSSNNSPGSETVDKAIDDTQTKYLNFDKLNTGFTVTPNVGATLVNGLTLTSANDAPERDPASYTLDGTLDGSNWVQIAAGPVSAFPARYYKHFIFFPNSRAYTSYRLLFPTVSNAPAANSMQISEVELLGVTADPPQDVTQPGDPIVPTSNNSPGSETVDKAIDDTQTKYLNFDELNTGFTVSPRSGLTLVSGLTLLSANDAPERDPSSYVLSGSHDGSNFVEIANGTVPAFPGRYYKHAIFFSNSIPYLHYRLIFPTVSNAPAANSMQIAEVELLGVLAAQDVTVPGDPIVPTSNNSPGSETVDKAIDDTQTKYLNFDELNTGFTVTPNVGDTIVSGLTLLSANDAPERDPSSYVLTGANDGSNFVAISSGIVPAFPGRYYKHYLFFPNTKAFKSYRLIFPTVSNAPAANSMQIAEVEFLGVTPGVVNTNPATTLIRRQPEDTPVLLGQQATFRVVLTGPWKVQWYRNGVRIPGATTANYTTPAVTPADDGAIYHAVVQSSEGVQESDHVILSIFTPSTTESIGLSWRGGGANGAPTDMLPVDITGFHQQAYWNNLAGGSGTLATPINSSNQPTTIQVTWTSSGEWGVGTGNSSPTERMLNGIFGWDDTANSGDTNTATLTGVPPGTHSLLIYTVQVPLEFFNMNFQVITHDAGGGEIIQERFIRPQNSDEYNPSPGFILVTATVATNRSVGNMMRFDNLQPGPDGIILVRFWSPGRASLGADAIRGPGVNGMQLLLNPPPAGAPPVIVQQPVSKNGAVDGQVLLSVTATGPNLTYQWLMNGQAIQGETNSTLVLTAVTTNDIGRYTVAIQNTAGRIVSRPAFVDVLPTEQITEGLIFYYRMDDQGGIDFVLLTDYSGHNVHGGVRGSSSPDWPVGLAGSALNFDGSVYGVVPDYPKPSEAMTISGWIYPAGNPGSGPLVNDWIPGNPIGSRGQFQLDLTSAGQLEGRLAVGANVPLVSGPVAATPDWHHFAMTANGSTLTLYWDGTAVDTADYLGSINNAAPAVPVPWLAIGADLGVDTNTAPTRLFTGMMDDIALFGRSLSDEEISAIYFAGLNGMDLGQVPPVITVNPRLSIGKSGNAVTISWRSDFQGYVLKSSPSLMNPVWTTVPGVVNNSVTIDNPTGTLFFRLEK